MIDNAVAHFQHLVEQGKTPDDALSHCVQTFGVKRTDLVARIDGHVANSQATKEALAATKLYFDAYSSPYGVAKSGMPLSAQLLMDLYEAITGELLESTPK